MLRAKRLKAASGAFCAAFTLFSVVGRLLCGAHWLTDILGGALLSAALVTLYAAALGAAEGKSATKQCRSCAKRENRVQCS